MVIILLERTLMDQNKLYLGVISALIVSYALGVAAAWNGQSWLLSLGMILLSPVAMLLLRIFAEDWFDRSFFDPRVMSLSFVLGDTVLLPLCLFQAAAGWNELPMTGWHRSWWYVVVCLGAGLVAACAFRLFDGQRYIEAGVRTALLSPTKVWHDWVVIPAVTSSLTWLLVPQLVIGRSAATNTALLFLAIFFVALIIDEFIIKPDPTLQHPRWNAEWFMVG